MDLEFDVRGRRLRGPGVGGRGRNRSCHDGLLGGWVNASSFITKDEINKSALNENYINARNKNIHFM
jgi:hypothetical protein